MPGEFMSKSPYFAEELIIRPGRRLWRVVRYRWHASGFEAVEAMADTSKPVDMSVDGNVVGRIGQDEISSSPRPSGPGAGSANTPARTTYRRTFRLVRVRAFAPAAV
jgi:hypothetical protein